jgi:sialidase-1
MLQAVAPVVLAAATAAAAAAGTPPATTRVFVEGESGIACWRIPALVDCTPATPGTASGHGGGPCLLAFAEARITTCADKTRKMLAMKRSTDSGSTWTPPAFIVGDNRSRASEMNSYWNPEPVFDAARNVVILSYLHNRTNCIARPGHCAAFQIRSTSGGQTWQPPEPLAPALGQYSNGVRPGPGRGLQLTVGPKKGRILASGSYDQLPKAPGERTVDLVWWSDDGGQSYNLSRSRILDADESSLAQLANGTIVLSIRTPVLPTCKCRALSRSEDFGETWSPLAHVPDLITPGCQGSMIRPTRNAQTAVYFSGPSSTTERVNMTVKRSEDGGATFPSAMVIYPGPSAYSCLAELSEPAAGDLGLLFEHSVLHASNYAYGSLSFARVPAHFPK